jgi:hypothetical protein
MRGPCGCQSPPENTGLPAPKDGVVCHRTVIMVCSKSHQNVRKSSKKCSEVIIEVFDTRADQIGQEHVGWAEHGGRAQGALRTSALAPPCVLSATRERG